MQKINYKNFKLQWLRLPERQTSFPETEGQSKQTAPSSFRRHCLRCRNPFTAVYRFLRLCPTCKGHEDWQDGNPIFTAHGHGDSEADAGDAKSRG